MVYLLKHESTYIIFKLVTNSKLNQIQTIDHNSDLNKHIIIKLLALGFMTSDNIVVCIGKINKYLLKCVFYLHSPYHCLSS